MSALDAAKVAKLPAWARTHLARLERQLADAVRDRDELSGVAQGVVADAWRDPYGIPKPVGGADERVRFYLTESTPTGAQLDEAEARERWVDVRVVRYPHEPARLELMGGRSLVVRPGASNVATLDVER